MIEKQSINGKEVWIEVQPHHVQRENPRIIPTEYFIARYYLQEPANSSTSGPMFTEKDGSPKLFESPVAALEFANEKLNELIHML